MQRTSNKRGAMIGNRYRRCLLLAFLFVLPLAVKAQLSVLYLPYLQGISARLNNPSLSYHYQVSMVGKDKETDKDSISGNLFRYFDNYLDSSSLSVTLKSNGYFFKADKKSRKAFLYNIATVQKRLGLKPEDMDNRLLNIPDSLLARLGKLSVEDGAAVLTLTYQLKENTGGVREFMFRINKKDMAPLEIRLTAEDLDAWGNPTGYYRIYRLFGFSNRVDGSRINLKRYVSIDNKKAILNAPYQQYNLSTLL